jgi:hypothetical protein
MLPPPDSVTVKSPESFSSIVSIILSNCSFGFNATVSGDLLAFLASLRIGVEDFLPRVFDREARFVFFDAEVFLRTRPEFFFVVDFFVIEVPFFFFEATSVLLAARFFAIDSSFQRTLQLDDKDHSQCSPTSRQPQHVADRETERGASSLSRNAKEETKVALALSLR